MKYTHFFVLVLALFPIFATATGLPIDEATYYSDAFEGGSTSNGDRFEQVGASAAQCVVPLGHYVYVSRGGTGVVVDANDRPNCSRHANVVDLSSSVFRLFAPLSVGRLRDISVTDIGPAPTDTVKKSLPRDVFAHLGVTLTSDVPNILFAGQGIVVSGMADAALGYVIVSVSSEDESYKDSHLEVVPPSGRFQAKIRLPDTTGKYAFVIAAGKGFNTNKYATFTLIEKTTLTYPTLPEKTLSISPRVTPSDGTSAPTLVLPPLSYAMLDIRQGKKSVTLEGNAIVFDRALPLTPGRASIVIRGNTQSTTSPLDKSSASTLWHSGSVLLEKKRAYIGADKIYLRQLRSRNLSFSFIAPDTPRIIGRYFITHPDGNVQKIEFPKEFQDELGLLIPGSPIRQIFALRNSGVYKLELVKSDGEAYVNLPILQGNIWPILETNTKNEIETIIVDITKVRDENLRRLNLLRSKYFNKPLILDDNLNLIAQAKVDDIIARGYAPAHRDIDGNYIDNFAKKRGLKFEYPIAENIASGFTSHIDLQDGLEESGSHKFSMLNQEYGKVGIGYGLNQGKTYLVQIFGN